MRPTIALSRGSNRVARRLHQRQCRAKGNKRRLVGLPAISTGLDRWRPRGSECQSEEVDIAGGIAGNVTGKVVYGLGRENSPLSSFYWRLGAKSSFYPSPGIRTPHSGYPPGNFHYTTFPAKNHEMFVVLVFLAAAFRRNETMSCCRQVGGCRSPRRFLLVIPVPPGLLLPAAGLPSGEARSGNSLYERGVATVATAMQFQKLIAT